MQKKDKKELHFSFLSYVSQREMRHFFFTLLLTPVCSHTIRALTPNTPQSHAHPYTHALSNNKQPLWRQQQQQEQQSIGNGWPVPLTLRALLRATP